MLAPCGPAQLQPEVYFSAVFQPVGEAGSTSAIKVPRRSQYSIRQKQRNFCISVLLLLQAEERGGIGNGQNHTVLFVC